MRRWIRRGVQLLALVLLVVAPVLGLWGVTVENRYSPEELAQRYSEASAVLGPMLDSALGTPADAVPGAVLGGAYSLRFLGLEIADPLALADLLSAGAVPPLGFLGGALLVLAGHLLLGRWICGWVCPYGILSRALSPLRRWLDRRGLALHLQVPPWVRWVLLVGVFVMPALGVSLIPAVLPYLAVTRSMHALWFGSAAVVGWAAALLISDLLLWDHGVCRHICPSGALQRLLGHWRVLRLGAVRGVACERGCHDCAAACWLGLDPRPGQVPDDCDACGRCTEVCPPHRIEFNWTRIGGPEKSRHGVKAAAKTATLGVALLLMGCRAEPPEVLSPTASWTSPFEAIGSTPRTTTREYTDREGTVSVSTIDADRGLALRLYLESEPGEPYTGPLVVAVDNGSGRVEIAFDAPTSPRSVRFPAQYEATVEPHGRARLVFLDGPRAGRGFPLTPSRFLGPGWVPVVGVLLVWLGLLTRKLWQFAHRVGESPSHLRSNPL